MAVRTGIGVCEWEKAGPAAVLTAAELLSEDEPGQQDVDAAWAELTGEAQGG